MLSERVLIRAALLIAFLGLGALYALLLTVNLPLEQLAVVEHAAEGKSVRIQGTVVSVRHSKNVTILTLREEVERIAVIFSPVNVTPGTPVEIEGEISVYRGEAELIVESMRPLE